MDKLLVIYTLPMHSNISSVILVMATLVCAIITPAAGALLLLLPSSSSVFAQEQEETSSLGEERDDLAGRIASNVLGGSDNNDDDDENDGAATTGDDDDDTNTQIAVPVTDQDQHQDQRAANLALNEALDVTVEETPEPTPGGGLEPLPSKSDDKITLMTRNLYQGVDLSPLATATTATDFFRAVGAAYNRMQATNFPERAESLADEIMRTSPDLIGLQEAVLFRTQIPADGPATPATNVSYDFIQILLDALEDRGMHYTTAMVQTGFDIEAPGLFATGLMDVRLTDRDAILVRDNLKDFGLSNAQGAQYAAKSSFPSPFGSLSFSRSWTSVDVTFNDGNKTRIVSTHLEPISPSIQILQATELLNGPGDTDLPLILIGDFNSNADGTGTATYANLIAAGFKDAWTIQGQGNGLTCCQHADLLNPDSALSRRIDLVLFRGNVEVQAVQITGNTPEERTPSGLWPSDHAGLVAKLELTHLRN